MNVRDSSFRASQFATIQKSGSVSVRVDKFLASDEGRSQLKKMGSVREIAQNHLRPRSTWVPETIPETKDGNHA